VKIRVDGHRSGTALLKAGNLRDPDGRTVKVDQVIRPLTSNGNVRRLQPIRIKEGASYTLCLVSQTRIGRVSDHIRRECKRV
jgi:hypothetical protein